MARPRCDRDGTVVGIVRDAANSSLRPPLDRGGPSWYRWDAMTTPFVCILLAWVLAYAPKLASSVAMARQPGGYDNKQPRGQQSRLEGWGARAQAAHANGMENLPAFGIAVLVAHVGGGDPRRAGLLAISYVVARGLYIVAYLGDSDRVRSLVWSLGFLATAALLLLPAL
jgi:uncharacterized MAPEG superfamily protein